MNHEETVAKAEELGLDIEDQTDEALLAAITEAEAEDKIAAGEAEQERLEAEQQAETARIQAEQDEEDRVKREEKTLANAASAKASGRLSPTKLYLVTSAFWFTDSRTGKTRKADSGTKIRLTDAQAPKYTRNRNVSLVA